MMGFLDEQIQTAWDKSEIKTTEGLILYIENHP